MYKDEKHFVKKFMEALVKHNIKSYDFESSAPTSTPDIHICHTGGSSAWIEAKYIRKDEKLVFQKGQQQWLRTYHGKSYVVAFHHRLGIFLAEGKKASLLSKKFDKSQWIPASCLNALCLAIHTDII